MEYNEKQIIAAIREIPEQEPPERIRRQIMLEIRKQRPRRGSRLFEFLTTPLHLRLTPAHLVAFVFCMLALIATIRLEPYRSQDHSVDLRFTDLQPKQRALVHYRFGKTLLEQGLEKDALYFFTEAANTSRSPEYYFWQGMAYYRLGNLQMERNSYLNSLDIYPNYLPALLNLGNSFLETGLYRQALQQYMRVIAVEPAEKQALFNLALIYGHLKQPEKERDMLRAFLTVHRSNGLAGKALQRLHTLGSHDFRSYRIGARSVIVNQSQLLSGNDESVQRELEQIALAMKEHPEAMIHIVMFSPDNLMLARERALSLQKQLLVLSGMEHRPKITASWFAQSESQVSKNNTASESDSLLLFTTDI